MRNEWLLNALQGFAKWVCGFRLEVAKVRLDVLRDEIAEAEDEAEEMLRRIARYEKTLTVLEGAKP